MRTSLLGLLTVAGLPVGILTFSACGGGDPEVSAQRDVCDAYIECATNTAPETIPDLMESYGDSSVCWEAVESAQVCAAACLAGQETCGGPVVDTDRDTQSGPGRPMDSDSTDGGSFGPRDLLVNSVQLDCDGDRAIFNVSYDGWMESVRVDTRDTGTRSGSASLILPTSANLSFCADGSCDEWRYTLAATDLSSPCSQYVKTSGAFQNVAVRVSGEADDDDSTAECVIFGRGSRAEYGSACTCAEAWLFPAPNNPCGN